MTCPVSAQIDRYIAKLGRDIERDEYIEKEADALLNQWKAELSNTGIILDLGWEWADVKAYSIETNQIYSTCTPMWDHLWQLARDQIKEGIA